MTAPAVMAPETSSMAAIPTRPTPMVPATVQELPIDMDNAPQIRAAARY
jgi:hypothetical protein